MPRDAGDEFTMAGVLDVTAARELVAFLAVLAPALAVPLAGDCAVSAAGAADSPRGQDDVDRPQDVDDPVTVLLHATGVHQVAGFRGAPELGRLSDRLLGDPGHRRRSACGVHSRTASATASNPHGVVSDELMVEPVVLDHQVEDPGVERRRRGRA